MKKQKNMPKQDQQAEYTGGVIHIILTIPAYTYHLEIVAKTVDENEETHAYNTRMTLAEIRQARQDFLENFPDGDEYDAVWALTDKGKTEE